MSYFLFFFNILVGLFSGFLRITLGIVLGVVFLARIDRSTLMQGFQRFDRGMLKSLKGKIKLYTVFRYYDNFYSSLLYRLISPSSLIFSTHYHPPPWAVHRPSIFPLKDRRARVFSIDRSSSARMEIKTAGDLFTPSARGAPCLL